MDAETAGLPSPGDGARPAVTKAAFARVVDLSKARISQMTAVGGAAPRGSA